MVGRVRFDYRDVVRGAVGAARECFHGWCRVVFKTSGGCGKRSLVVDPIHSRFPRNPGRRGPPHAAMFRSTFVTTVALAYRDRGARGAEPAIPGDLTLTDTTTPLSVASPETAGRSSPFVRRTVRFGTRRRGGSAESLGTQGHQNYVLACRVEGTEEVASGGSDAAVKLWHLPADAAPRLFAHTPDVVLALR